MISFSKFPVQPTLVVDCEGSGPMIGLLNESAIIATKTKCDRLLGFGISVGFVGPESRTPNVCARMSVGIIPPDMHGKEIPSNTREWHKVWSEYGWDEETFYFWSGRVPASEWGEKLTGHLPALNRLWSHTTKEDDFHESHMVVGSYASAATLLNNFLASIEAASPTGSYVMLTDALAYDPALTFGLLAQNNYLPMTHLRNAQYRWHGSYDEDSLLVKKPLSLCNWDEDVKPERDAAHKRALDALPDFLRIEHHPQADAAMILMRHLECSI